MKGLSATAAIIGGLVLMAVVLFFFLKEGDRLWRGALDRMAESQRPALERFGDRGWHALRSYFLGVTTVAVIDAVLIALGLLLLGVPLVLSLAVLTFFAAYFPVIGAFAAGVVAVLVAFVSGGRPTRRSSRGSSSSSSSSRATSCIRSSCAGAPICTR